MTDAVPLPGALRLLPAHAFAGRVQELATLRALVPRAPGEGRRAALVAGEPGSGKSRLVRELAHAVSTEGVTVLYGDCDGVVGVPYGPFPAALGHLVTHLDAEVVRGYLGVGGGELTRLLPDLEQQVGPLPRLASTDADTERHRLHTAVTELLVAAAADAPLLLVLEDVHWADPGTLQLMRHLVRSGAQARMLLVATFRDAEAEMPVALSDALVDVYRSEGVVRVRLGGLSEEEIAEFVRLTAGVDATAELRSAIAQLTGGNAFLVNELWRELAERDAIEIGPRGVRLAQPAAELETPTSVREVVGQRLSRLTPPTVAALELAAVVGAEFRLDTLRRAGDMTDVELGGAIDESIRAGLLLEEPGPPLAYRFAHELVRRAIADRPTSLRRAELHLRVATGLEQDGPGGDRRARLAALAHHFTAAAPLGVADQAVEYNLRAAESAVAAVANDEAAERFRAALSLGLADEHDRAAVSLELGHALHRAGRAAEALAAFSDTADLARTLGDPELLARAAIGFEETCWRPAIHDGASVALLEEAAVALSAEDSELRALVFGGLARARELRGEGELAARARDESIAMSRRRGDRQALARTLAAAYWARGLSTNEEVERLLLESQALAEELGDVAIQGEAAAWLPPISVVLCDHDAARDALARLFRLTRQLNEPFLLHVAEHYAAALALCDGDIGAADEAAHRSFEWGRLLTGRNASGSYGIQMFSIRREQGRLAELAPVVRLLDDEARGDAWRPGLVALLAELGIEDEARRRLRAILDDGLGVLRPSLWLASLTYLADACVLLRDADAAEAVYAELVGEAGTNVMVGHLVACYGSADRYLGSLAALLGEWDRAEEHFEAALGLNTRLGARTWLAHTAAEYARMLRARGREGDRAAARAHLGVAAGLAGTIGLEQLSRRIGEFGGDTPEPSALPDGLTRREVEILGELAAGASNREIGLRLHISEHTAANHIRSILRKTRCTNRTEAAAYALRRGLVSG